MKDSARVARIAGTIAGPALVIVAALFVATFGGLNVIPQGPIDGGGWTARSRGWLDFNGFYPAELEDERAFSWMGATGRIRISPLDRSVPWRLSLWVQPAAADRPTDFTATVDGLALPPSRLVPGQQRIDIELPPARVSRAVINLAVSETLVPATGDTRTLGLRVDSIAFNTLDGRLRIPSESLRAAAVAGVAVGVLLAVTLGAGPVAWALGLAVGSWLGFLLVYDGSFLGPFPERLQTIALCAAALAPICALRGTRAEPAMERRGTFAAFGSEEPWSFRAAAGVVIAMSVCKLALFFHPMVTVGDSIFHVHRAQLVQAGEYFFTSITPRPFFEFPYPPGLYVTVAPLWKTFRQEMQHVWLLRSAAIAAEALLALAIYGVVRANWQNRMTAFFASTISLLLPVGLYTICTSNLTNSYGQSLFGMGMAALLYAHLRRGWIAACVGTALIFGGFLSHFSTFSVGVPLVFVCAAAVFAGRTDACRRSAIALALALLVATTASVAVYYAHFMPVYKKTADRILAREGEAPQRSMVAPVSVKAQRVTATVWSEFGAVVLIGAALGAAMRLRARARDPLTLALLGWGAVVVGFWVLGVVTAVEMRASLAALPMAAILVSVPLAFAGQNSRGGRIVAAAALAAIVVHAVSDWCMCLGIERFWEV